MQHYLKRDPAFESDAIVPQLDEILADFLALDPTGEAFRFPATTKGARFLQDTSHINILVFAQAMQFVHEALSFFADTADELLREKQSEPEHTPSTKP